MKNYTHTKSSSGSIIAGLFLFLLSSGCFMSTTAISVQPHSLGDNDEIGNEAKVFTKDGSVYLFDQGFQIKKHSLDGTAKRYSLKGEKSIAIAQLDMDEIIAVTYYKKSQNAGTSIAAFLAVLNSPSLPLGIYCISCPKCCFGSCPTIYTPLGNKWALETECFSSSVSKLLEEPDLDRLTAIPEPDGSFKLKITNEALETHYINQFSLMAAHHPIGTKLLPTDMGGYIAVKGLTSPFGAINRNGKDLLATISSADSDWYRSGSEMVTDFPRKFEWDWIDLTVKVPPGKKTTTVVLRERNTLLSTILFYDIVLGSQGINALEWTKKMNTNPMYASQFKTVYKMFSGLALQVKRNGVWKDQAFFGDSGPLTWKEIAATIPVTKEDSLLELRLKFFPDNVMVDEIKFCFDADQIPVSVSEVPLDSAIDRLGTSQPAVKESIASADSLYLETNPGDCYMLSYHMPMNSANNETTLFIQSQGYYTEWLRGNWIRKPQIGEDIFDLNDLQKTLRMLAASWQQNRDEMEKMFFQTRIPLREKL